MRLQDHVKFTRLWVGNPFEHSQVYVQPGVEATVIYIHSSQRFANVRLKGSNVTLVDVLTDVLEVIPASKFEVGQYVHVLGNKEVGRVTAPCTSLLGAGWWVVEFIPDGKKLKCHQDNLTLAEPAATQQFNKGDLVELLVDQPIYINLEGQVTHMVTKGTMLLVHDGANNIVGVQDADGTGPVFYVTTDKLRFLSAAPILKEGDRVRLVKEYVLKDYVRIAAGKTGIVHKVDGVLIDVEFNKGKLLINRVSKFKFERVRLC